MKRKLLAAALAMLCLAGCGAEPLPAVEAEGGPLGTVAYVPLDDRPVNTDRVAYLAESLNLELRMPEEALYHTCLDGQARNPNGAAYGDRAGLLEWVLDQEEAGCDLYLLSLDQLLSGGLVNSRSFSGAPLTLSDGGVLTETEALDRLLAALDGDPDNRVYLLDTVMRLAPTVGYDGWDLEGYEALRAYGMAERAPLSGGALTVENIVAGYAAAPGGGRLDPADYGLSGPEVERYLATRARKLALTDHALRATAGLENVRFLIGVDDSAPSASIQTNELAYLRRAVEGRGALLSGADEDGMLALCRLYADLVAPGESPTVWVRYFGGSEDSASSDYDHQPMTDIVAAHLDYLGLAPAADASADLQVLVLTAPADEAARQPAMEGLLDALEENEAGGVPTVLMDAAKNSYGTDFQDRLVKRAGLGFLLGYAGYYDLANATGIALANGAARWLCLRQGGVRSTAQEQAFLRTLADSLVKDLCYKNDVKVALIRYVKDELSGDPDNFARTDTDPEVVQARLAEELKRGAAEVLRNLERSNFLTSLEPGAVAGWGEVTLSAFRLPWQRLFELRMDIGFGPFTEPHRRVLHFFYT